jgi:excinuclease UvrABC nuclease subunit
MKLNWRKCAPPAFDNIPEKPGVYILSTIQRSDDRYEAKFVGKAADLKASITQHWSDKEASKALKTHISKGYRMKVSYAEVEKTTDREGIEVFLIKTLKPAFNGKKVPTIAPLTVNLPAVRGSKPKAPVAPAKK